MKKNMINKNEGILIDVPAATGRQPIGDEITSTAKPIEAGTSIPVGEPTRLEASETALGGAKKKAKPSAAITVPNPSGEPQVQSTPDDKGDLAVEVPLTPAIFSAAGQIVCDSELCITKEEKVFNNMPNNVQNMHAELCWLVALMGILKSAARLVSARIGILLMFLKATTNKGSYEEAAKTQFPFICDRTRRYCAEQARELLPQLGIEIDENGGAEHFARLKQECTLTVILQRAKSQQARLSKRQQDETQHGADAVANESEEKSRSSFIKVDTFKKNCERFGESSDKILTHIKRLGPGDLDKAATYIDKFVPESGRGFYRAALAERKKVLEMEADHCGKI